MPLYEVTAAQDSRQDILGPRLIQAKTKSGALTFAAKTWIKIEKATPMRAHTLAARGVKVEDATETGE